MNNKFSLNTRLKTVKAVDQDDKFIHFEGTASTQNKDRHGDIIPVELWTKDVLDKFKENPIVLHMHDHKDIMGVITELTATENGLDVKGKIYKSHAQAEKVEDGVLKSLSISFITQEWDTDRKDAQTVWIAKDIELLEISVVAVGANSEGQFSVSKALGNDYKDFKNKYINKKEMDFKAEFKALLAKFKSGDGTDEEKTELKGLIAEANEFLGTKKTAEEIAQAKADDEAKAQKEADEKAATEKEAKEKKEAEELAAKKALEGNKSVSEIALEKEVAELKAKIAKKDAKPIDTGKEKDADPNGNGGLNQEEKRLNGNAEVLKSNVNKWK